MQEKESSAWWRETLFCEAFWRQKLSKSSKLRVVKPWQQQIFSYINSTDNLSAKLINSLVDLKFLDYFELQSFQ